MANHHFISYSTNDAVDFALQLCDSLKAGPPSFPAWLDKRELKPGPDWDDQIVEAIRNCDSLLFIMTRDSVESKSVCKNEWTRAMKYKKPVIPILVHADAEIPLQLENRQHLDFTGDFKTALARLRNHLLWLRSPEGQLQMLKDRLTDAERDLRRTDDEQMKKRIREEIGSIGNQIESKEKIINDPEGEKRRVEETIAAGIERERRPREPISGVARTRFINPPPGVAPAYWQDRIQETKLVGQFLANDAGRLMTVVGRAGIGKTAMTCRLLKSLENGRLPDDLGSMIIDGIVYLSERGSRKVSFGDLFSDLCKLLPEEKSKELDRLYKEATIATSDKMKALLRAFTEGKVLMLLDNFEDKIDYETREIKDAEMDEALRALLTSERHGLKVIITTRFAPRSLLLVEPHLQQTLSLDDGLGSPFAENILREMDRDGRLCLRDAPADLLGEARERTRGYPRALEALFAILSADRETSLPEILADAKKILPEYVVEKMVGEAFSRLDPEAKMVMQALAVYGLPVSNVAVDYLLQPYLQGIDSAKTLNRLFNMQFVRKEQKNYCLHPVDREYALSAVRKGEPGDRVLKGEYRVFSRYALWHRGAEYFQKIRLPHENWKKIDDLAPQLAEFELLYSGAEYDAAAGLLFEIDYSHLYVWGNYRAGARMHERLRGKIDDPNLKANSIRNLGTAYWSMGQSWQAIVCYEEALEIVRLLNNREFEGKILGDLGNCHSDLGDTRRAIEYHEQALAIARKIGDKENEGVQLGNLASCYSNRGDTHRAIEFHEQALTIAKEICDRRSESRHLGNLGNCYTALGETLRAIEYHEQALTIAREVGNRSNESAGLGNLGNCYAVLGEINRSIEYYKMSLAIAREIETRKCEGVQLGNLGWCYSNRGDTRRAIEFHEQALTIAKEIGDRRSESRHLGNLGNCYTALGETLRAIEYHEQALAIAREIGNRSSESNQLGNLGNCCSNLGNTRHAIEFYEQALAIAREIGDRSSESALLGNLGNRYSELGDTRRAIELHEQALAIAREIGSRNSESNQLVNLGNRYSNLGDTRRAIELHEQALSIAREIGDKRSESIDLINAGDCYSNLGQPQQAERNIDLALEIAREIDFNLGEAACLSTRGELFLDNGQYDEATAVLIQAITTADKVQNRQFQNISRYWLALVHLYRHDPGAALLAITEARQFDYPPNNHNILKLLGIILLHKNNIPDALASFTGAITESDAFLAKASRNFDAIDSRSISLCGLALCSNDPAMLEQARTAFLQARAINSDAGYLQRVRRLFDKLAKRDDKGMLDHFWAEEKDDARNIPMPSDTSPVPPGE